MTYESSVRDHYPEPDILGGSGLSHIRSLDRVRMSLYYNAILRRMLIPIWLNPESPRMSGSATITNHRRLHSRSNIAHRPLTTDRQNTTKQCHSTGSIIVRSYGLGSLHAVLTTDEDWWVDTGSTDDQSLQMTYSDHIQTINHDRQYNAKQLRSTRSISIATI